MNGFTIHKRFSYVVIKHTGLQFSMMVYRNGNGNFFHWYEGNIVDIPMIEEINLGGFPNPQTFDNIRHDILHVWFWFMTYGELSPNHRKLMAIENTPLWKCHWEEYKVESLELYILTGEKREALDCYDGAKAFIDWMMSELHF